MILITRPIEDSAALQEILHKNGYETIIEPMLTVTKLDVKIPEVPNYITTSKNAADYVPNGFHISIPEHGKNASEILKYTMSNLSHSDGKIIYLRGNDVTLDIVSKLRDNDFDIDEIVVYKTASTKSFSDNFLHYIYKIQVATLFSVQTLENFLLLVKKHNLKEAVKGIKLLALSEKITLKAGKYDFKEVFWADLPNQQSLIEKLYEISHS